MVHLGPLFNSIQHTSSLPTQTCTWGDSNPFSLVLTTKRNCRSIATVGIPKSLNRELTCASASRYRRARRLMHHAAILHIKSGLPRPAVRVLEDLLAVGQRSALGLQVVGSRGASHRHAAVSIESSAYLSLAPGYGMVARYYGGQSSGYDQICPLPARLATRPAWTRTKSCVSHSVQSVYCKRC